MPYSDQWGITLTRIGGAGSKQYTASRLGVSGAVAIDQVFATESINVAAALFRACEMMAEERAMVGDGTLAALWWRRHRYAVARWKLLGYQALINAGGSAALRNALRAKRDRWVTEEDALRIELGTDA